MSLFSDLLDRAYFSKIELYQGEKAPLRERNAPVRRPVGDGEDDIVTPNGSEIPVDYRMQSRTDTLTAMTSASRASAWRPNLPDAVQSGRVTTESYESLVQKAKDKDATPAAMPAASPRS